MYNLTMEKNNKKIAVEPRYGVTWNLKKRKKKEKKEKKKIAVEPIDTDVNRFLLTNGI